MRHHRSSVLLAAGVLVAGVAGVSAAQSTDPAAALQSSTIELEEITQSAGLWDPLLGMYVHATATADVNDDGWLDLFVGSFKFNSNCVFRGATECAPDRLLLGGPSGFTVDETFPEMVDNHTSGAVFTDLDNDGDLDLVVSRGGIGPAVDDTRVLRNDSGQFVVSTLITDDLQARHIVPFDYNADGLLDLFIVEDRWAGQDPDPLGSSRLFRNLGDLQFEDATEDAELPLDIYGLAAAGTDLTGDGWPDLLVSGTIRTLPNGQQESSQTARIFVNNTGTFTAGTFTEVDASVFRMTTLNNTNEDESAGVAVGDLNRDGWPDVVLGHHLTARPLMELGVPTVRVYLHQGLDANGEPVFADVTADAGIPEIEGSPARVTSRAPHVEIVDFDNDGWPDIHTGLSRGDGTEPVVFQHSGLLDGNGVPQFENPGGFDPDDRDPTPEQSRWETSGLGFFRYWAPGASADYDNDGRVDSFLGEWFPELPSRLFRNVTENTGNWIGVDVVPHVDGVGAKVDVYPAGDLGDPEELIGSREIRPDTGYASGIPTEVHFGLGAVATVDIRATLSHGRGVVEMEGVAANQSMQLPAADAELCAIGSTVTAAGGFEIDYVDYPQPYHLPRPGSAHWSIWGEGLVASSGKFYSTVGDHHAVGDSNPERNGNSFLYEYDPDTLEVCAVGDALTAFGQQPQPDENGYGKIHSRITEAPDGSLYMTTHTGEGLVAPFVGSYQGDLLLRYDPVAEELESLGVQVPETNGPVSNMWGDLFYGVAFHHKVEPDPTPWPGTFWVYDTTTDQVIFESQTPRPHSWDIAVDRDGRAYYSDDTPSNAPHQSGSGLFRYDPATNSEEQLEATFSNQGFLNASTPARNDPDGTIAMATSGAGARAIYLFNPETETLTELAEIDAHTKNIALDPITTDIAYFMQHSASGPPEADPDAFLVEQIDLNTGVVSDVIDVGPILNTALGEYREWTTFSLSVSPDGKDLYIAANSGPNKAVIGTPTLVVIHLPDLIADLDVNDTANADDWSVRGDLQVGDAQYGDRALTLASIPSEVAGAEWIRTANDSKGYTASPVATFTVTQDATVYVAHNDLIDPKPTWLSGWTDTGLDLVNSQSRTFSLYSKAFAAEATVELGPNGHTTPSMYTVIVEPAS